MKHYGLGSELKPIRIFFVIILIKIRNNFCILRKNCVTLPTEIEILTLTL